MESDSDEDAAASDEELSEDEDASAHAARLEDFRRLMRERVLTGAESAHVDYRAVDADAALDDAWARVAAQDAEDEWFSAD